MAVVACSRVFGNCLSRFPGLRGESCVLTMEMGLAGLAPCHLWLDSPPSMEAAMRCEQWHAEMIERPLIRQMKDTDEERAIVLECPKFGHTEYQPQITSFWRRLAA